jgi:hypothetical protein
LTCLDKSKQKPVVGEEKSGVFLHESGAASFLVPRPIVLTMPMVQSPEKYTSDIALAVRGQKFLDKHDRNMQSKVSHQPPRGSLRANFLQPFFAKSVRVKMILL